MAQNSRRSGRRRFTAPFPACEQKSRLGGLRVKRGGPQRDVSAVAQRHCHLPRRTLDLHMAEELHAGGRRQVLPVESGGLDESHLGTEGVVELVRSKCAGVERTRNEFPEW